MGKLQVELHVHADEDGLWLEDVHTGQHVPLPYAFGQSLVEALDAVGQEALAERLLVVVNAAAARRIREEAKLRCMDPVYSKEECSRCKELLEEDIQASAS
ncbi:hypothetical protein H5T53_08165 [Candidatus Bipolaricaulota bacterium]|nr:hypothetical protein [Candidatus Bipolaricaulota bacterium]